MAPSHFSSGSSLPRGFPWLCSSKCPGTLFLPCPGFQKSVLIYLASVLAAEITRNYLKCSAIALDEHGHSKGVAAVIFSIGRRLGFCHRSVCAGRLGI